MPKRLRSGCALVLGLSANALADTDRVEDPQGDSREGRATSDFKAATHGHEQGGFRHGEFERGELLRHTISVYGDRISERRPPILVIDIDGVPFEEYVCGRFGPDDDDEVCARRQGDPGVSGDLDIRRLSASKLEYTFKPSAIGKPENRYFWFFQYPRDDSTPFHRHQL